jgi:hypothetical protein
MTDESQPVSPAPQPEGPLPRARNIVELPGMVAIALYLVVLAAVVVLGVAGGHYPPLLLLFSALFLAAAGGLMFLLRWAWAMALAAVVLLAFFNVWIFMSQHVGSALVQGLLNWVFFFYLIRPEVRTKLR